MFENKRLILSIDDGGMRCVIPLMMLIQLEERTGRPAYDLFDMVTGAGSGAIIAAALAVGMSARQILQMVYRERLYTTFAKGDFHFWLKYALVHRFRYQYRIEPFIQAVKPYMEDIKIGDIDNITLLLLTRDLRTNNTYYVVNRGPGALMFRDWPLVGAVAASSAAPHYFRPVNNDLINAGMSLYGNASLVAAIEAFEYIGYDPAKTILMSFGTGFKAQYFQEGHGKHMGFRRWLLYNTRASPYESALQQVYATRAIYHRQGVDFRRYNPFLDAETIRSELEIESGRFDPACLNFDSCKPAELRLLEAIGYAYGHHIDWSQPYTMPWDTRGGHRRPSIAGVDWGELG